MNPRLTMAEQMTLAGLDLAERVVRLEHERDALKVRIADLERELAEARARVEP